MDVSGGGSSGQGHQPRLVDVFNDRMYEIADVVEEIENFNDQYGFTLWG